MNMSIYTDHRRSRWPWSTPIRCRALAILCLTVLVASTAALPAAADTFTVDRFDDPFPAGDCSPVVPSDCSVREAVINANTTVGPDLIVIPAGLFSLTRSGSDEDAALTGDLDITEPVLIQGAGQNSSTVDGGGVGVLDDRIFDVHNVETIIEDLTIRGGEVPVRAGGIYNRDGSLTLLRVTITQNRSAVLGGGMQNTGTLVATATTFFDNEASQGGAIDAAGTTTLIDSFLVGNHATGGLGGGAILSFFENSLTTLSGTVVRGNLSATNGGAISAYGPVDIVDSVLRDNEAGDEGGAIYVNNQRTVTIERSSLINNTAVFVGGAISVDGTVELTNATISSNHAGTAAGGLVVDGIASLLYVTVAGNTSAVATALNNSGSSNVTIGHTIISGSCNSADTVVSLGGNVESPADGCRLDAPSDQTTVSASQLALSGLGDFGGFAFTRIPRPGSVAIDVQATCPPGIVDDQREGPRPLDGDDFGGAQCDAGAVEVTFGEDSLLFADDFETGDVSAWQ